VYRTPPLVTLLESVQDAPLVTLLESVQDAALSHSAGECTGRRPPLCWRVYRTPPLVTLLESVQDAPLVTDDKNVPVGGARAP